MFSLFKNNFEPQSPFTAVKKRATFYHIKKPQLQSPFTIKNGD